MKLILVNIGVLLGHATAAGVFSYSMHPKYREPEPEPKPEAEIAPRSGTLKEIPAKFYVPANSENFKMDPTPAAVPVPLPHCSTYAKADCAGYNYCQISKTDGSCIGLNCKPRGDEKSCTEDGKCFWFYGIGCLNKVSPVTATPPPVTTVKADPCSSFNKVGCLGADYCEFNKTKKKCEDKKEVICTDFSEKKKDCKKAKKSGCKWLNLKKIKSSMCHHEDDELPCSIFNKWKTGCKKMGTDCTYLKKACLAKWEVPTEAPCVSHTKEKKCTKAKCYWNDHGDGVFTCDAEEYTTPKPTTRPPTTKPTTVPTTSGYEYSGSGDLVRLTDAMRQAFVDRHNYVRNRAAGGLLAGYGSGYKSGSKMPLVQWDTELEHNTNAHGKQCIFKHGLKGIGLSYYFGENVYASSGVWPTSPSTSSIYGVIDSWAREHLNYNHSIGVSSSGSCMKGKMCGHYTQVVWEDTLRIGCSISRCSKGVTSPYFSTWARGTVVFCQYYKGGNYRGRFPYTYGSTASACPSGRDSKWTNLCKHESSICDSGLNRCRSGTCKKGSVKLGSVETSYTCE